MLCMPLVFSFDVKLQGLLHAGRTGLADAAVSNPTPGRLGENTPAAPIAGSTGAGFTSTTGGIGSTGTGLGTTGTGVGTGSGLGSGTGAHIPGTGHHHHHTGTTGSGLTGTGTGTGLGTGTGTGSHLPGTGHHHTGTGTTGTGTTGHDTTGMTATEKVKSYIPGEHVYLHAPVHGCIVFCKVAGCMQDVLESLI